MRDDQIALIRAAILSVLDETAWPFYHDADATATDEDEANAARVEFADRVLSFIPSWPK